MDDLTNYQINKDILCIDLKAFYASVECVIRGLDPFTAPLVVADRSRGKGALALSVTPYLKNLGVPSRCRIYDLPVLPGREIIYAKPRMKTYMEYSIKVIEIYLRFISDDDLYVYSIDEAFLDLTPYRKLYNKKPEEIAKEILQTIYDELKLYAVAGVGSNMLMAKLAMDIEGKKSPDFIASWNYDVIEKKLWPISPLSDMWGIGYRMERNLNQLGLYSIGDIAAYPRERLHKLFGIMGDELWFHCHGIDQSILQDKNILRRSAKSVGQSQVLFHDYYAPEIYIIMQEMVDAVTRRLRLSKRQSRTIHLSIGYSGKTGGGFAKQITLDQATSSETIIFDTCMRIFNEKYDDSPIRTIGIAAGGLTKSTSYQYSIFEDAAAIDKEFNLMTAVDEMKNKFGKNAINRASALEEASTIINRNKFVGGHHE